MGEDDKKAMNELRQLCYNCPLNNNCSSYCNRSLAVLVKYNLLSPLPKPEEKLEKEQYLEAENRHKLNPNLVFDPETKLNG